jgi:soluble lytic murein transglycosylase-like protein
MDSVAAISMFLFQLCGWNATDYAGDVVHAAKRYDLDPRLLVSMMFQESRCKPDATGKLGELGLMQLKRDTWALSGYNHLPDSELRMPALNIMLGARHLRRCLKKCGGFLAGALGLYSGLGMRKGVCRASSYSWGILARLAES